MIKDELDRVIKKIPHREAFEGNEEMWDTLHDFLDSGNLVDAQIMLQFMAMEYPEYENVLYEGFYGLDSIMFDSKYGD